MGHDLTCVMHNVLTCKECFSWAARVNAELQEEIAALRAQLAAKDEALIQARNLIANEQTEPANVPAYEMEGGSVVEKDSDEWVCLDCGCYGASAATVDHDAECLYVARGNALATIRRALNQETK